MAGTGAGVVIGGTVLLAIVAAVLLQTAKKKKDCENLIEECFGKPMVTNTFTMGETRDWIASRKESLENNAKVLVTTLDQKNLEKYGIQFQVKEPTAIKNYLLLAAIDTEQEGILESALVKYGKLDPELKAVLEKGEGSLVVTV